MKQNETTHLFLHFRLSTLFICKDPIFDVIKITKFGVLYTTRILCYFCYLHVSWAKPITITKGFILNHLVDPGCVSLDQYDI